MDALATAASRRLGAVPRRSLPPLSATRRPSSCVCRAATRGELVAVRYVRDGEPKGVGSGDRSRRRIPTSGGAPASPSGIRPRRIAGSSSGGDYGYAWLNGAGSAALGRSRRATTSWPRLTRAARTGTSSPSSTRSSRTASRRPAWTSSRPSGQCRASGTSCPRGRGPETPFEWFGGDLAGLERRLDHIGRPWRERPLLTPDLSRRQHAPLRRDDASTLSIRCSAATPLSSRSSKPPTRATCACVGDLTTNHLGLAARVVRQQPGTASRRARARASSSSTTGSSTATRAGYDVPSLPKLDHSLRRAATPVLRQRRPRCRQWLDRRTRSTGGGSTSPTMTGRLRGRRSDLAEVASGVRSAAVAAKPDAVVVAEHCARLLAETYSLASWHGTMSYAGFTRPVWAWLRGDEPAGAPRRAVPRAAGSACRGSPARPS